MWEHGRTDLGRHAGIGRSAGANSSDGYAELPSLERVWGAWTHRPRVPRRLQVPPRQRRRRPVAQRRSMDTPAAAATPTPSCLAVELLGSMDSAGTPFLCWHTCQGQVKRPSSISTLFVLLRCGSACVHSQAQSAPAHFASGYAVMQLGLCSLDFHRSRGSSRLNGSPTLGASLSVKIVVLFLLLASSLNG